MKYHPIPRNSGPYVFEKPRSPWPDRILYVGCVLIIGLAGAMLLGGLFGFLDGRF